MPAPAHPLPPATQLESYWIQRLLATGGFSRVYLAHDENDVPVAIKEYRIAEDDRSKFLHGMRCFFEEGRALTRFSHPCLLYTSDAADERSSVDLGGRRII